jgi:hypothetical protein
MTGLVRQCNGAGTYPVSSSALLIDPYGASIDYFTVIGAQHDTILYIRRLPLLSTTLAKMCSLSFDSALDFTVETSTPFVRTVIRDSNFLCLDGVKDNSHS